MITDFRINEKGELEGKVIPPDKWEEIYTKTDVVTMLTEIQIKIEEKATEIRDDGWWLTYNYLIQEKIDKLKENENGNK